MDQQTLAALCAILAWVALIAYAILGGADFGGGIWDLLATGPTTSRQRSAIARGMGPVWESNNVWLIFVLVITWTAFPVVFAGVMTALYIPITFALIGIVLRGAAFAFRSHYGMEVGAGLRWGHVFNSASIVTPFLFGTMAGALASGGIRITNPPLQVQANAWTIWTTPFALTCGLFAIGMCAVLSATYLIVDALDNGDASLAEHFRQRAIISGAITALLGAVAALLAHVEAPVLWHGLLTQASPLVICAMVVGLATAWTLLSGAYRLARVLVAAETAFILAAWGVAQWPYLIVPDVTILNAASPASVLGPTLIVSLIGLIILLPALWYLFSVFKRRGTTDGAAGGSSITTAEFVASFPASFPPGDAAPPPSDIDAASAVIAPSFAVSGASTRERLESVLACVVAAAAAVMVTRVYDGLRQLYEGRRGTYRQQLGQ